MIFPCPWAPYIPTLCIISGTAQYLEHNNISLLGCQLLTFPMGHATVQGTFFLSIRFQKRSFFERKSQCGLKHFKVLKFKISSFLVFQISSGMCLLISKVSTLLSGPVLESQGMYVIFQKKCQGKGQKRTKYLKISAKMYKI